VPILKCWKQKSGVLEIFCFTRLCALARRTRLRHTRLARFEETVNHATHTTRRPPRNDALEFNNGERERYYKRRTMDGGGCVTCAIKFNRRTYGAVVKFHPLRLKIWFDPDDVNLIFLESRCDTRHDSIGHVRLPKFRQTSAPKPPASVPIGQKSMSSSCAKF
jgi:hypothetical protein